MPLALCDLMAQLEQMDADGIRFRVVSLPPFALDYGDPHRAGRLNAWLARAIQRAPAGRFVGLGSVPLQSPPDAASELRRAVVDLGLKGVIVGNCAGDLELDDAALEPFWAAAEEHAAVVFVHPAEVPGAERMSSFHLRNLVGNPCATALAAVRLVFGGVLDRHPGLRIVLAHGGGVLPWIVGRLDHGYEVRRECRVSCEHRPSEYLSRFFYDTVLFGDGERAFLRDRVGGDRVLYGTDAPFDMADQSGAPFANHRAAAMLFGLDGRVEDPSSKTAEPDPSVSPRTTDRRRGGGERDRL